MRAECWESGDPTLVAHLLRCGSAGEEEDSDDDEDAVAREVMLDRHKPRFGEQAMAPIKVSSCRATGLRNYFTRLAHLIATVTSTLMDDIYETGCVHTKLFLRHFLHELASFEPVYKRLWAPAVRNATLSSMYWCYPLIAKRPYALLPQPTTPMCRPLRAAPCRPA